MDVRVRTACSKDVWAPNTLDRSTIAPLETVGPFWLTREGPGLGEGRGRDGALSTHEGTAGVHVCWEPTSFKRHRAPHASSGQVCRGATQRLGVGWHRSSDETPALHVHVNGA